MLPRWGKAHWRRKPPHLRHRSGRVGEEGKLLKEGFPVHVAVPPAPTGRTKPAQGNALGMALENGIAK